MNEKKRREDRNAIMGKLIDEFFERKAAGEEPSIDEYAKRFPEYADDIRTELEQELFWLSKFGKLKQSLKAVSTEEELERGWEKVRANIKAQGIWVKATESLWRLVVDIKIQVAQTAPRIKVHDVLQDFVSHRALTALARLKDGSRPEAEALEVSIPLGTVGIAIYPSLERNLYIFKVRPQIEEARRARQKVEVILRDLKRDKETIGRRRSVYSGEIAQFDEVSIYRACSISIRWKEKAYEIPFKFTDQFA